MQTSITLIIFKRPDTTVRVLDAIRQVKPTTLFVVADGPRVDRPGEAEKCAQARAIVEQVDWDCEIVKDYSEINLGCGKRVASGLDWVFKQVEQTIILEDDCLPHPSFFPFCEELLERYRFDDRINSICAQNFAEGQHHTNYSYYFSRYTHSWGWATWRRAWQHFDIEMTQWPDAQRENLLQHWLEDRQAVQTWQKLFQATYQKQIDTWDYQWLFSCWLQGSSCIHPVVNSVSNIGTGMDATHMTEKTTLSEIPLKEIQFPLLHPEEVERDRNADQYIQRKVFDMSYLERAKWKMMKTLKKLKLVEHSS